MTGGWWEGGRPWEWDGRGCEARVVREKGAWRDSIRDECTARSACVPGGGVTGPVPRGRAAPAGQAALRAGRAVPAGAGHAGVRNA